MKKIIYTVLILLLFFMIGCTDEPTFTLTITNDEVVQVNSQMHLSANAEVSWSSSDPLIATVDDLGIVYGISQGNVTIIATLKNDETVFVHHQVTVIPSTTLPCEECPVCPEGGVCPTFSFPEPISEDDVYVKFGIDR
ncbi:MAG: Ig-like domain-containing protein, partial [Bacilli bacterium]